MRRLVLYLALGLGASGPSWGLTLQAPSAELVKLGTSERMVPMLMTALVTAAVFLPFVIFGNIAGHEILHPMAIVILGGLVSSTLVNLFVVPSLYLEVGAQAEPFELDVQQEAA